MNPSRVFNTYDTDDPTSGDGGTLESIVSLFPDTVREILEARSGKRLARLLEMDGKSEGKGRSIRGVDASQFATRDELEELRAIVFNWIGQAQSQSENIGSREAKAIHSFGN